MSKHLFQLLLIFWPCLLVGLIETIHVILIPLQDFASSRVLSTYRQQLQPTHIGRKYEDATRRWGLQTEIGAVGWVGIQAPACERLGCKSCIVTQAVFCFHDLGSSRR